MNIDHRPSRSWAGSSGLSILLLCLFSGIQPGINAFGGLTSVIPWKYIFPFYEEYAAKYADLRNSSSDLMPSMLQSQPECDMTTTEIIQYFGYPAEIHHVITEDGYILELHRIPHGRCNKSEALSRGPVLLQHGLLASSSDWIINKPSQSLGYMLADYGYDVWLGNIRGNTYSHNHTNLDIDSKEFWEFSYDEMGKYDLPAMIDYILAKTSNKQLSLVGHSMGTTVTFAMLSTKVEYNDKIKTFFALGPVAAIGHLKSKVVLGLSKYETEISLALRAVGVYSFLGNSKSIKYFAETTCATKPLNAICADIVFQLVGSDPEELNMTRLPVYFTHTPARASVQTVHHFSQNIKSNKLQHFDWGFIKNFIKYGQSTPPAYDLTKVTVPTVFFYGLNDLLAVPEDVDAAAEKLPNLVGKFQAGGAEFNHLDLVWGINAGTLLNQKIIELMRL